MFAEIHMRAAVKPDGGLSFAGRFWPGKFPYRCNRKRTAQSALSAEGFAYFVCPEVSCCSGHTASPGLTG